MVTASHLVRSTFDSISFNEIRARHPHSLVSYLHAR